MESFINVVHLVLCTVLILLILIQSTKGSEIGAAFGGASQTLFGSRGPATFLNKITIVIAIFFLVTSVALAQMAKERSVKSVLSKETPSEQVDISPKTAPAPESKNTEEKKGDN